MNENKVWSREEVFNLIYRWKLHPELWDIKDRGYRNKAKKQCALNEIANEFLTTEIEVTRKFHNLRTQFHQELRRSQTRKTEDATYKSSWKYFDAMCFILSQYKPKSLNNVVKRDISEDIDSEDSGNTMEITMPELYEEKMQSSIEENSQSSRLFPLFDRQSIDEFQIFGNFVASELRNLKSREHQNKLKRMIQRSILEISEADDAVAASNRF